MPLRRQFSELEIDALTELVNISVSSAATSLSRVVREEVLLSVPALSIVPAAQAPRLVSSGSDDPLVGVRQHFHGDLTGQALLLFPQDESLKLAELVAETFEAAAMDADFSADALRETGNIVLQSCLSAIANLLRRTFQIGEPEVVRTAPDALLASPDAAVLLIYMNFEVRGRRIRGYVALLLDLPSLEDLRLMVGDFISRAAGEA